MHLEAQHSAHPGQQQPHHQHHQHARGRRAAAAAHARPGAAAMTRLLRCLLRQVVTVKVMGGCSHFVGDAAGRGRGLGRICRAQWPPCASLSQHPFPLLKQNYSEGAVTALCTDRHREREREAQLLPPDTTFSTHIPLQPILSYPHSPHSPLPLMPCRETRASTAACSASAVLLPPPPPSGPAPATCASLLPGWMPATTPACLTRWRLSRRTWERQQHWCRPPATSTPPLLQQRWWTRVGVGRR